MKEAEELLKSLMDRYQTELEFSSEEVEAQFTQRIPYSTLFRAFAEAADMRDTFLDLLQKIWLSMYPGDAVSWEYPGQIVSHLMVYRADSAKLMECMIRMLVVFLNPVYREKRIEELCILFATTLTQLGVLQSDGASVSESAIRRFSPDHVKIEELTYVR